ncbi:hypothetical protein S40285_05704 [Stachybotrys chlorohalonatus IBT 40285]|uniref:Sodium/calcium exchanger membrane region domain-containing protein n=1 Tax=Stachybotrys chlorohalonatus (strain IBT 40285) TaxID=1283841 RepID=A0A084QF18_STAC4|nr:hypothetical protein S40285_05704 [Stachybotrys chlorohalonata IBT 40285]
MHATRSRGGRLSARPFYTTVLLLSLLAAYSFVTHTTLNPRGLRGSDLDGSDTSDASLFRRAAHQLECRDVHRAKDQCAFVKKYCMEDDVGLVPYLQLYYCAFEHAQPVAFVFLVGWLGMLFTTIGIAASDFFSINLSTIATILGLSESLAGVTFLAFGNGSPDVFSTFAAMGSNSASMAFGELIGAAGFITGVVAGSMALVREFKVDRQTYVRDICFFVVAVGFTMVFLVDGNLYMWECCVMVGYYALYVVTVVVWHWFSTRRKERLRRERLARSHVYAAAGHYGDELAAERYRDDPDEVDDGNSAAASRTRSENSLSALERGPRIEVDGHTPASFNLHDTYGGSNEEEDEEETNVDHNKIIAAEVASSMRILRTRGKRSNTITPIRPSLVGALEFRSALAQLQRESNLQLSNIPGRSYSENLLQPQARAKHKRAASSASGGGSREVLRHSMPHPAEYETSRNRALSAGNMPDTAYDLPSLVRSGRGRAESNLSLPPPMIPGLRTPSPAPSYTINGSLAPPPADLLAPADDAGASSADEAPTPPALHLRIPSRRSSASDSISPSTPFPQYTDSPMLLSPHPQMEHSEMLLAAGPGRHDGYFADIQAPAEEPRPLRWWPYTVLPPPHVLFGTFFPTLRGWHEKSYWDMFVSAISVPSIFLLVITLPVVESETNEGMSMVDTTIDFPQHGSGGHMAPPISVEPESIEPESEWQRYRRHTLSRSSSRQSLREPSPEPDQMDSQDTVRPPIVQVNSGAGPTIVSKPVSEGLSTNNTADDPATWNRWLVMVQIFTGPLFAVAVLWANLLEDLEDPRKTLVMMILYSLLGSLIMLGLLVVFTSEHTRPKYHYLLCFLGFIISIAWISTIAGEVVGVLKTLGVALDISEALLGLTIFAAGNSVGDLIADITVARLGFPVMALSACFGGPMLNILLGIGIGGLITMIEKANHHHHKHPDRPYKYGPFHAEVSGSLVLSAVTLVITLFVLLIGVPMNKWVLSRKIGYTVIAIWAVSTVLNVIVELTGVWSRVS